MVAGGFPLFPMKLEKFPPETIWYLKHCQQVDNEYLKDRFVKAHTCPTETSYGVLSFWVTFLLTKPGYGEPNFKSYIRYYFLI